MKLAGVVSPANKSAGAGNPLALSTKELGTAIALHGHGAPQLTTLRDATLAILHSHSRRGSADPSAIETMAGLKASFEPGQARLAVYDLIPRDGESQTSGSSKARICEIAVRLLNALPLPVLLASAHALSHRPFAGASSSHI